MSSSLPPLASFSGHLFNAHCSVIFHRSPSRFTHPRCSHNSSSILFPVCLENYNMNVKPLSPFPLLRFFDAVVLFLLTAQRYFALFYRSSLRRSASLSTHHFFPLFFFIHGQCAPYRREQLESSRKVFLRLSHHPLPSVVRAGRDKDYSLVSKSHINH